MTLPTGAIAMSDVNTELGQGSTTTISLNDTNVRNIAGLPSGAISMNDLRGKSASSYGTLSPNLTTIAEGGSVTFTLSGGSGIPNGTYYWRVKYNSNLDAADFTATSGSFSITSNTGSFVVTTVNDYLYEGYGSFYVEVSETSGFDTVRVTSTQLVTVSETVTYTAATPSNTNPYRFGAAATYRTVNCVVNTTQVPDGTTVYWDIGGTTAASELSAASGSFTITSSKGTATLTVNEVTDGSAVASTYFVIYFYTDSARTKLVATSATITIRAAPTYGISWSPTTISEGGSCNVTVTTTNLPPSTTLYYTTSGTASATADFLGIASSGSITLANNSFSFTITGAYDGLTEGTESLTMALRTVSTSGTIVSSSFVMISNAMGTINTLTASKTGGATAGSSVSVYLQIASIAAYPAARTFSITYNLNLTGYTNASLVTTTITVAANATSSSNTLVYSNASAGTTCTSLVFQAACTGHTTKTSNTLSGGYV